MFQRLKQKWMLTEPVPQISPRCSYSMRAPALGSEVWGTFINPWLRAWQAGLAAQGDLRVQAGLVPTP